MLMTLKTVLIVSSLVVIFNKQNSKGQPISMYYNRIPKLGPSFIALHCPVILAPLLLNINIKYNLINWLNIQKSIHQVHKHPVNYTLNRFLYYIMGLYLSTLSGTIRIKRILSLFVLYNHFRR